MRGMQAREWGKGVGLDEECTYVYFVSPAGPLR